MVPVSAHVASYFDWDHMGAFDDLQCLHSVEDFDICQLVQVGGTCCRTDLTMKVCYLVPTVGDFAIAVLQKMQKPLDSAER